MTSVTTGVKICGINDPAAFDAAVEAGADWIGFVFFARSPRFVTPAQAATLSARHPRGPERVGLFVDPTDDEVADALDEIPLDALQLYAPSASMAARIAALRASFGVPVWQALGIATPADLPRTIAADRLLIEPRPAPDATRPGGNATPLDLNLLAAFRPSYPWMLAGGLTPATVAAAITATQAPAVDVSSGVETAPGRKDPRLILEFVRQARGRPEALPLDSAGA